MDVTRLFPTPPFPLIIPITFFTELPSLSFSSKLFLPVFLLSQSKEQVLQLPPQFSGSLIVSSSNVPYDNDPV